MKSEARQDATGGQPTAAVLLAMANEATAVFDRFQGGGKPHRGGALV